MHDHKALGFWGWVLQGLSVAVSFAGSNWAVLASLSLGAVGAACHVVRTRAYLRALQASQLKSAVPYKPRFDVLDPERN
jgi:hypothetical protein